MHHASLWTHGQAHLAQITIVARSSTKLTFIMGSKGPNLKSYLDKTISLHLNKGRKVRGTLRGYDQFMNIVLGDAVEEGSGAEQNRIGMVVVRGNSIVQFELVK